MKKYFILAAAVLTMTACSNDENENSVINDNAINLTANVAGATATRAGVAVQSTYFDENELINVEATPYIEEAAGTMASAIYKTSAVTSTTINALNINSGETALRWPAIGTVAFRAFYPSTVTSSTTTFSVLENQSDANYKASDLMYGVTATEKVSKTTSAVELTFTHALTKIIVNLSAGDGMTGADIAACTIKLHAKKTADIVNGVAQTATGDVADITMGSGTETAASSGIYAAAAIIVPQTVDGSSTPVDFITITTSGNHSVTYQLDEEKAFAAGNVYTFNFTVGISGIILQSTQITDWINATGNTINGGSLTL